MSPFHGSRRGGGSPIANDLGLGLGISLLLLVLTLILMGVFGK